MKSRFGWVRWLGGTLLLLILLGLGVREWQTNRVVGHSDYRFNLAVIVPDKGVSFVSIDPAEKSILALPFPTDLAINSRGSGEYSISSLYKLGSYTGEGGRFARQKIQGFMRVPVPGYVLTKASKASLKTQLRGALLASMVDNAETNLSRFDAWLLLGRISRYRWREIGQDELVRAGVIEEKTYHPERLQEYVGSRLFDWGIGESQVTVAIVNASGENGLGSDMADFLTNLGLDVVMLRSVNTGELLEHSEWQTESSEQAEELSYIFVDLFGLGEAKTEQVGEEYRSSVLLKVGKDAKELF